MRYLRLAAMALLASIAAAASAPAQQVQRYGVPRTEYGHPDFQGVWATEFLTMLERPPGVENLVASPDQAQALAQKIRGGLPAVIDPQVQLDDIKRLAMVKGEYRTSVIVDPKDGRMPFTQAGIDLAARIEIRDSQQFDNPEERPLAERCLESLGYAPIRTVPVFLPRQIVQTRDHVIEDDTLYTQPWTGEFSMTRHDGPLYEYACHEGNYSLPNALRGGRAETARAAETNKND